MAIDLARVKKLISEFNLKKLFIDELGWNHPPRSLPLPVTAGERQYSMSLLAEKSGFQVFACELAASDQLPDANSRLKIERQLTPRAAEHLIVFLDAARTMQFWQWARREPNTPIKLYKETFTNGSSGERLAQKLAQIAFSIEEEEKGISVTEVARRTRGAFYAEKVTKSFYGKFKTEHDAFFKQIKGIEDEEDRKWYASLMLNRLMFVYFIQRKGFLDGDSGYLQTRLKEVRAQLGKDKFHSFYRSFLLRLFHEGLGGQLPHSQQLVKLIGRVPYLNGGLFDIHQLESDNKQIEIPDKAFGRIFEFFDEYDWHLDSRPLGNEREINPDVLGYIFEQYINNKQMGAYYTKEDITEYISKNTIIPFLFDRAAKDVAIAFDAKDGVWQLLRSNPDRYIYEAVRFGVIDEEEKVIDLPAKIVVGLNDVGKRDGWNKPADAKYALPTETWREHVARRKRCLELRGKLQNGEIHSINDLITWNLDIRQFAQDVLMQTDSSDLVRAFYRAIAGRLPEKSNEHFEHGITVLDPTCGSGAFLFAALNILQPLYEACLDRMEAFVAEADLAGASQRFPDFRNALDRAKGHPNRDYYILKSIIIGNLYGVDIMEEAVEICKLRLFLKLAAQVERDESIENYGLEPLPDIDFNIRAGNTLVGFVDKAAVDAAFSGETQGKLAFDDRAARFNEDAEAAERAFEQFRLQQTKLGGAVTAKDKARLRTQLKDLSDKLDHFLAHEYGVDTNKRSRFEEWRKSHQPFHWYTEFFGIIKSGGFDVVIGNPPYIELKELEDYRIAKYVCEPSGNLYALVIERSLKFSTGKAKRGFIVPVSSISTDRYESLQRLLAGYNLHHSSFDDRPSRLFDGLEHIRLTIHLIGEKGRDLSVFSTRYNKWSINERENLFDGLSYAATSTSLIEGTFPKLSSEIEETITRKLIIQGNILSSYYTKTAQARIFYSRKVGYFLQILDFEPRVLDGNGIRRPPSEFKALTFTSREHAQLALCCLNSNLFYWFVTVFSDCRHINKREVDNFPINLQSLGDSKQTITLLKLAKELMNDLKKNSQERKMRFRHDNLSIQCIFPKHSKHIIDEIDHSLARHYSFTDEELDFIINYDIKYRMGLDKED